MRARAAVGALAIVCSLAIVLTLLIVRSQVTLVNSGYSLGAVFHDDHKAQKYTGWSLADEDFPGAVDESKGRICFYIMASGLKELPGVDALLRTLYHPDHFFLIHLDIKARAQVRADLKGRIARVIKDRGHGLPNVRLVEPSVPVTWGGFTMTLNAVYGLTQALHWTTKWDYFINLSASDLPLLSTDEIASILGEHKAMNTSFIKGFKYQPSWEGYKFVDRREMFAEDVAVFRDTDAEKRWPWAILDPQKEMLTRPMPNTFTVYKGEFWVILHRSMAEYVHKSPDNQARALLAYFSGMMVSDEEFFQTVACNPTFPHDTLRTHSDNMRFVNWWGDQASPAVVPPFRAVAAANSGALFGRKFSSSTVEGRDGIRWIEEYLADTSRTNARVGRVKRRLAEGMSSDGLPVGFCGKAQVKKPPEAYYAVEGDEEKLPLEFQSQLPRGLRDQGQGGNGVASAPPRREAGGALTDRRAGRSLAKKRKGVGIAAAPDTVNAEGSLDRRNVLSRPTRQDFEATLEEVEEEGDEDITRTTTRQGHGGKREGGNISRNRGGVSNERLAEYRMGRAESDGVSAVVRRGALGAASTGKSLAEEPPNSRGEVNIAAGARMGR